MNKCLVVVLKLKNEVDILNILLVIAFYREKSSTMPAARKRTASGSAQATKKQKTATGSKQKRPEAKVDEGFDEDGKPARWSEMSNFF